MNVLPHSKAHVDINRQGWEDPGDFTAQLLHSALEKKPITRHHGHELHFHILLRVGTLCRNSQVSADSVAALSKLLQVQIEVCELEAHNCRRLVLKLDNSAVWLSSKPEAGRLRMISYRLYGQGAIAKCRDPFPRG